MSDTAPQPPPRGDILERCLFCDQKSARRNWVDFLCPNCGQKAGEHEPFVLEARIAAIEAELAEARERLAMAVEALEPKQCRCRITSDPSKMSAAALESGARYERIHECARCAALAATAASVAQHTASVERRGAAKELRARAAYLYGRIKELNPPCFADRGRIEPGYCEACDDEATECEARAAELEGS